MARRRHLEPFEVEIEGLGKGGVGVGVAPDDAPIHVRFSPPGALVHVVPQGKRKGVWSGRRVALTRPPAAYVEPPCDRFGLCGGCALQELDLPAQWLAKADYAVGSAREAWGAAFPASATVHPPRGAPSAYGYRNKVELSFGPARFLSEADHAAGLPIQGRFLGFHAPGRFDRVVDVARCWLVDEPLNMLITATREVALDPAAPPPRDPHTREGFWRHLLLRQGFATGEVLAVLYTAPADEAAAAWAHRWLEAVRAVDLGDARLVGAAWAENAEVADVARGEVRARWGRDWLEERLLGRSFRLSATSFFQTSTAGAEVLYQTVGEAVGDAGGTLLDLYCGTGTIGIALADRFERVIGVEERAEAVADARENAARNGVRSSEWRVGKVEDALDVLAAATGRRALVVDPPRVGLHPSVARHLAEADAEVLVYVACHPASLGRDGAVLAAGGWRLTDLWPVDLFPQTGHVELVGRFVR